MIISLTWKPSKKDFERNFEVYLRNYTGMYNKTTVEIQKDMSKERKNFDLLYDIFDTVLKTSDLKFRRREKQRRKDKTDAMTKEILEISQIKNPSDEQRNRSKALTAKLSYEQKKERIHSIY